jgi:hypothetical protein
MEQVSCVAGDVRAFGVVTLVAACSGQPAPALPPPPASMREIVIPIDAPMPVVVGAACDSAHPCGGALSCGKGPGGYCTTRCTERCGDDPCVDGQTARFCRAACTSNDDCRDGYACDPLWKACTQPNAETIVVKDCGAPPGFGRDPAFGPATHIASGIESSSALATNGSLVVLAADRELTVTLLDARGEVSVSARPVALTGSHPWLVRDGHRFYATVLWDNRAAFSTSTDGVTWSAVAFADDAADCATRRGCASRPMTIVGPDPQRKGSSLVYVAYAAGDGLRVRASSDGKTFGPPRTALAGTYGHLDVGADGTLYAVAVRGGPGVYGAGDNRIDFAASIDGGKTFGRPQMVSVSGERVPYYFANPSIVVDSARKWIYLAYARGGRDAKWDIALLATNDFGKTWKRTRIGDDPPCAIHMVPNLALDPTTGQLHVAWYDSRGLRFAHAVCTSGLGLCRQLGRINDQPFAALSTMRAGELAVGDYQSLVVDNTRRVLHAVWTQSVVEQGRPIARIFHAKAKLPVR